MTAVIPSRESAATKARRYITDGRLTIETSARIDATCRGDGQVYELGYAHGRWHCNCPARTIDCAHLLALRLVVDRATP